MRPIIIAGNWKLNPDRQSGVQLFEELCRGLDARTLPNALRVLVCPPAPYLGLFSDHARSGGSLQLGSQDVAIESWGAYTGALGAELLSDFGVQYTLVGHSERRQHFGESDSETGRKVERAAATGLIPVLCVGETEVERDAEETFEVVERQLRVGLERLPANSEVVVAYEPVWAIGTGRTATPEQAAEVHRFVRMTLRNLGNPWGEERANATAILYGGSVKPDNAAALLADEDIDGALIGGASLKAESFLAILDAGVTQIAS